MGSMRGSLHLYLSNRLLEFNEKAQVITRRLQGREARHRSFHIHRPIHCDIFSSRVDRIVTLEISSLSVVMQAVAHAI